MMTLYSVSIFKSNKQNKHPMKKVIYCLEEIFGY